MRNPSRAVVPLPHAAVIRYRGSGGAVIRRAEVAAPNARRGARYSTAAASKEKGPEMAVYYALSRRDDESDYEIYGKGEAEAEAEAEARRTLRDDHPDSDILRRNLMILERGAAEAAGHVRPGAPVIWYAHLGRYHVEDHAAPATGPRPTGVTSR